MLLVLDILSDIGVVLAIVMIIVGWRYSVQIGSRFLREMPSFQILDTFLSTGWYSYVHFEIEILLNHIKQWGGKVK